MKTLEQIGMAVGLTLASVAAGAQSWTVTLGPNGTVASTTLQQAQVNLVTGTQATIAVQCPSGVDCTQISAGLALGGATTDLSPTAASTASASFAIPGTGVSNGSALVLSLGSTQLGSFPLGPTTGDGTNATAAGSPPNDAPGLAQLLALPCPGHYSAMYEAKRNYGEVVVTPLGVVVASALDDQFDENDTLIVRVVADRRLLPLLAAERTSAFRDVGAVQILGGGESVPTLTRQAALVSECGERRFPLDDFAPGQATVQISALQGTQLTPTGSFDFNVNPLYTGMLTLGAAQTRLVSPDFGLATVAGQTVISAGNEGDEDLVYTLFYTPFLWGKRDVQKRIPWYQHVNLSIGIAPEDITDNAFLGVTVDLPAGFAFTYGLHFGQVESLAQGVTVGTPFAGTAATIPTANEWESDAFWAVSIDLSAMVQVFNAVLGSNGGTGGGGS
jgi:hypothetical protein